MIRYFILRIIVPLLLFLVLRSVLRSLFGGLQSAVKTQDRPQTQAGGELKKDPVCGTYVAASTGITHQIQGQPLYSCSAECRDKYRTRSPLYTG